jgi:hypothetical protein
MELIYKTIAGSRLYGTHRPDSDYDYRGIALEPANALIGLAAPFEQQERSEPHDEVYWGLRKFLKLSLQNNPNILDVLFAPSEAIIIRDHRIQWLLDHRRQFLSQRVRLTFTGYAQAQMQRLHNKIQHTGNYDKKHAAHLLRLLLQVKTILAEGDYNPVLHGSMKQEVINVLRGDTPLDAILSSAASLKAEVSTMKSDLPMLPEVDGLEDWVMNVNKEHILK